MAVAIIPFLLGAAPAMAGRTAIDQDPSGNPITASLSGYCDFNGDDCFGGGSVVLPYQVSIGGAAFTDTAIVHGNGLLTFGDAIDFSANPTVHDSIESGNPPTLTDYDRTLVSAGQSVSLDGNSFLQSAFLGTNAGTGAIIATWFTCNQPIAQGVCPHGNPFTLTLTPQTGGFAGHLDFSAGQPENTDQGYVSGGVYTATGNDFFLPAVFQGLTLAVPEPESWILMIAGFGLTGTAMRRRSKRAAAALA